MGTYDEAPDAIRRWLEEGADSVDLVLPLGLAEEQLAEILQAAAPGADEVAPLPGALVGRRLRVAECLGLDALELVLVDGPGLRATVG